METARNVDRLFKRKRWLLTLTYASMMGCTLGLVGYVFDRIVTNLSYQSVQKEITSLASNIHDNVEYKLAIPGKIPADRKSTRLNSSHVSQSRMPASA